MIVNPRLAFVAVIFLFIFCLAMVISMAVFGLVEGSLVEGSLKGLLKECFVLSANLAIMMATISLCVSFLIAEKDLSRFLWDLKFPAACEGEAVLEVVEKTELERDFYLVLKLPDGTRTAVEVEPDEYAAAKEGGQVRAARYSWGWELQ